ncbi:hypothetical protein GPECTOR_115g335 [Gonium pectorale]|uniref:Uncharacterized protein n=1 Tax=Gonium pectorale TaxID=33097 RepID=A0A150FZ07_GONPE|nr:hypothetical protein GPECTOR_115g335 [Gonium pectorale]|eukprot:KXZ42841.1 hypothetical protein GPECTOR_115g335 [Gonium pectorale]
MTSCMVACVVVDSRAGDEPAKVTRASAERRKQQQDAALELLASRLAPVLAGHVREELRTAMEAQLSAFRTIVDAACSVASTAGARAEGAEARAEAAERAAADAAEARRSLELEVVQLRTKLAYLGRGLDRREEPLRACADELDGEALWERLNELAGEKVLGEQAEERLEELVEERLMHEAVQEQLHEAIEERLCEAVEERLEEMVEDRLEERVEERLQEMIEERAEAQAEVLAGGIGGRGEDGRAGGAVAAALAAAEERARAAEAALQSQTAAREALQERVAQLEARLQAQPAKAAESRRRGAAPDDLVLGPVLSAARVKKGLLVTRGPDWDDGKASGEDGAPVDGGPGGRGEVVGVQKLPGGGRRVWVRWLATQQLRAYWVRARGEPGVRRLRLAKLG